jgi:hypothetical protein
MRKWLLGMVLGVLWLTASAGSASAQSGDNSIGRFSYYPYYYFPHNYWPTQGPQWPERPGMPYMRPPAYMAYPAFQEQHWRYELNQPQRYHKGFHFWLDQF